METVLKKTSLFIFGIILISCSKQMKDENTIYINNNHDSFATVDYWNITELKNNPQIIGKISSVDVINDSSLVISTNNPPQVIIFDKSGNQIQEIGKYGKGPNEYLKPNIVKYYRNNIYVWCQDLLKLNVYKLDGTPVNQYNFKSAIKDFEIYNNYACIYSSGGIDESIITIFDLSENRFKEQCFGKATKEHQILNMKEHTGGIALKDCLLYFSPTSYPEISIIDLSTLKLVSNKKIVDTEFKLQMVSDDINGFLMNQNKSIQYIFGSHVVTGVYTTDSVIVIRTEVGEVEMKGLIFKDASKRMFKSYVFDCDMNLMQVYIEHALDCKNKIYSAYNSSLYSIELNNSLEAYNWQKINIKNNNSSKYDAN
jgi:hypothetical protein